MRVLNVQVIEAIHPTRRLLIAVIAAISSGCAVSSGITEGKNPQVRNQWYALSKNQVYEIRINPEKGDIEIGPIHNWIINVREFDKGPVFPARITVGGGMSGHGHGLPTQPLVTAYGGNGDYLIEGIRFNMDGMWRLSFIIESHSGRDTVDFEIPVKY